MAKDTDSRHSGITSVRSRSRRHPLNVFASFDKTKDFSI